MARWCRPGRAHRKTGSVPSETGTGLVVKPSVSLLPPSPLQLSEGSSSLLCLLSGYSPQGALVSWTVDGSEVKTGVLNSAEEEKNGRYSLSSTLTLSKDLWEKGEEFICKKNENLNVGHLQVKE
ncbi:immunoglobulin lambda-1 light chain-like isoform X2 [Silurus meridionalis]|nr:immunoglobulin lambda-1 light chain-like isoform X2 [Silurus meridionalis]